MPLIPSSWQYYHSTNSSKMQILMFHQSTAWVKIKEETQVASSYCSNRHTKKQRREIRKPNQRQHFLVTQKEASRSCLGQTYPLNRKRNLPPKGHRSRLSAPPCKICPELALLCRREKKQSIMILKKVRTQLSLAQDETHIFKRNVCGDKRRSYV